MEALEHYQEITSLGKKIVKELFDEDSHGITKNWMANYVAELIKKAETEGDNIKNEQLKKECSEAILGIWSHRTTIPGKAKPLGNLKEALSILSSLSKNRNQPFLLHYYQQEKTAWGEFMYSIRLDQILILLLFKPNINIHPFDTYFPCLISLSVRTLYVQIATWHAKIMRLIIK